jgi:dUTP pyrophosphatase
MNKEVEQVEVPAMKFSNNELPSYAHDFDAGCDCRASIREPGITSIVIGPGEIKVVPLGFSAAIPAGYMGMITPRSGLAAKFGIGICNAPGIIDTGFRGEWGAIVINHSRKPFAINDGDRICQLVIVPYVQGVLKEADSLEPMDERGRDGFGSTGVK